MPITTDAPPKLPELEERGLSRVVFTREALGRRVEELGREISDYYRSKLASGDGESLLVLSVLKGSFVFLADLVRSVDLPLQIDFLVASSYGDARVSSGEVELLYEPEVSLDGRHVLLVEDIVDTGTTLDRLIPVLEEDGARSLEVCALLQKETAEKPGNESGEPVGEQPGKETTKEGAHEEPKPRSEERRGAHWIGFRAPDEFLVGYGLDYSENFRHLPYIASLKESVPRDVQAPSNVQAPPEGQ